MADAPSPNPYIRTYAKDMAALSGKPLSNASTPTVPTPTKSDDRDAVLTRLRNRATPESVHENTVLPHTLPTPVATVAPTETPVEEAPISAPAPRPQSPTPKPQVPTPVLKPQPPRDIPRPQVISAPVEPVHTPIVIAPRPLPPPPAPVRAVPIPAPVPQPSVPAPTVSRLPESLPAFPVIAQKEGPSPIHTYTTDFADRVEQKGATAFTVMAAEADAQPAPVRTAQPKRASTRSIATVIIGVFLILIAGAGATAAYLYVRTHQSVAIVPEVPSLVFADDRQALTGEGTQLVGAIAQAGETPLGDNQVRVLYLTTSSTTPDGKTVSIPLSGGRLIGALQLAAPDILLRNVSSESTVGVVHAGTETRAFFIMKVLSYERTFAGMLQWEKSIGSDLGGLYPDYPVATPQPTIATTTKIVNGKRVVATTTIQAAPVASVPDRFIDEIVANHDVRALKDGQNRTVLLYGYTDKTTLIIARDEAAFTELVSRLSATKQQ